MAELHTLLFVSRSTIAEGEEDVEIRAILESGRPRNRALHVTGALVFTGRYFAEVLEGAPESLDALLASIRVDARHTGMNIVEREPISRRLYSNWDMAYQGPSSFVSKRVEALFDPIDYHMAAQLKQIIRELLKP